jgi:hypothetical protein
MLDRQAIDTNMKTGTEHLARDRILCYTGSTLIHGNPTEYGMLES